MCVTCVSGTFLWLAQSRKDLFCVWDQDGELRPSSVPLPPEVKTPVTCLWVWFYQSLFTLMDSLCVFYCVLTVCSGGADSPVCLSWCSVGFGHSWPSQYSYAFSVLSHWTPLDPPGPQSTRYVPESYRWSLGGIKEVIITLHFFSWCFYPKRFTITSFNHVDPNQTLQESCICINCIKYADPLQAPHLEGMGGGWWWRTELTQTGWRSE